MNIEPRLVATDLSIEKRELLSYLLKEEGIESSSSSTIPRRENPDKAPLSFAQERLWFLDQLEPNSAAYNIPAALHLVGPLNVPALEQGLNEIVRRHEVLRTTFAVEEGRPVQVIAPSPGITLIVQDVGQLSEAAREVEVQRLTAEEARHPFDLTRGPLLRATLLRLGDEEHVLLLTMHHIVFDEWSFKVLNRELSVLYEAFSAGKPSPLPELPIQYADFACWQQEWRQGEAWQAQLAYWKKQLGGSLPVLELPTDRLRPAAQTFRGTLYSFVLPQKLSEAIKALSRRENVTLSMMLLAAFKVLLHWYTGQDDIAVGFPITGRNRSELEGLIGFFLNTLVLRTDLAGNPSFREVLGRVRKVSLEAYTHRDLPFERLVEELQPERDLSHTPLFQVMFILQDAGVEALTLPGLTTSSLETDSGTAKFDLTLFMKETRQGLKGAFEYNTDLFDATTIARMAGHFQTLLEGIVTDPEQRLSDLPLLTEAGRRQLLVEWNDTRAHYPHAARKCLHHLFEAQAEQTPESVAVVFEEEQLTYGELSRRANQLAHYLRNLGVGPGTLVGIFMERSVEMVIGLLGILKAGGAYVPLDPSYPQERISFMLEDAQAPVLLTQARLIESLPQHEAFVACLDANWETIEQESAENLVCRAAADDLAYVIYTSGSTGNPKGVAIAHRSTVALLHWAKEVFSQEEFAGVLASTSICFDLSVFELFAPLSWGGKAILAENVLQLPSSLAAESVTLVNTVPSAMMELLRIDDGLPASVRTVNLAGESLRTPLVQQLYKRGTVQRVYDLYGPSEDTIYSTFTLRSINGPDTIGRPIANTQIYLLDTNLNPIPVGVPGELYIGGVGLARGYLNRPELTAEKFIPNRFSSESGARLYRTGDLVRYLPDGNIEFLGRIDHQVKLRGFRIELGEIEATLRSHPAVREAVVQAREDTPGDKRLVAYVVSNIQSESLDATLRDHLKRQLPSYMIPSAFVRLQALPLTPNGKVDRRELPAPQLIRPSLQDNYVAPRTTIEAALCRIWAEVLKIEQVGVHDNFFELGGHSLLAVQIVFRVRKTFHLNLTIRELFDAPTIHRLAETIAETEVEQADSKLLNKIVAEVKLLSDQAVERILIAEMQ